MVGVVAFLGLNGVSQAAENAATPPTAKALVERYIEAAGGRPALEKLKTRVTKGKMEVTAMGVSGDLEIRAKSPNKQVSAVDLAGLGAMREGYDGTVAWSAAPGMGIRNKTGGELARVQRTMVFPRELKILETYERMEVKGSAKILGADVWVVEGSSKGSKPDRLFFDQKSGFLVREESTVDTLVGEMTFQIDMLDYRDVDGVKVPFLIKIPKPETMGLQIKVEKVVHNVEVPDSDFSKPRS